MQGQIREPEEQVGGATPGRVRDAFERTPRERPRSVHDLRILVLGLGDPSQGNEGIGGRLARSLFASFEGVEVRPASDFPGFAEILHDYDLIIIMKSLAYCGRIGHVASGSPYALADGWGLHPTRTEDLANAIAYARLMGHTLPRIEVVNVCVGADEWPEKGLSPQVACLYRGIVGRVRALVREMINDAEAAREPPPSSSGVQRLPEER